MKSNQLLIVSALCGLTAFALAGPCGYANPPTFDLGGQCKTNAEGDYCTQPSVQDQGGCIGTDNPKICLTLNGIEQSKMMVLRDPEEGCSAENPCVESDKPDDNVNLNYIFGANSTRNCP